MFRENLLRRKLASGQTVVGSWVTVPAVPLVDVICGTALDFVILDQEHGPLSFETIEAMIMVCESRGVAPLVRTGGPSEADILRALDLGAHGVQVPNVHDRATVEAIVRFAKFPPRGERGFSPFTRANSYNRVPRSDYTSFANEQTLVAIQVEGRGGIANMDDILQTDGLDIVFLGLFDISKALGVPGEIHHPKVQQELRTLVEKIKHSGKVPGTIVMSKTDLAVAKEIGVRYLTYSVDANIIANAYERLKRDFDEVFTAKV